MSDIISIFKAKKQLNIGYIVCGYPSVEYSVDFLKKAHEALDIIELGIPYSDPIADGKFIAEASFEASEKGVNTDTVFDMLIKHKSEIKIPMVFLVYYNLIYSYGVDAFIKKAKEADIKGFIIPDLPFEEAEEMVKKLNQNDMSFIPLLSVTSASRIGKIVSQGKGGFVYIIGALGITGMKQVAFERLKDFIKIAKEKSSLPVALGFGIKTNEDVRNLTGIADGLIIGTSIVNFTKKFTVKETIEKIKELFKID